MNRISPISKFAASVTLVSVVVVVVGNVVLNVVDFVEGEVAMVVGVVDDCNLSFFLPKKKAIVDFFVVVVVDVVVVLVVVDVVVVVAVVGNFKSLKNKQLNYQYFH